MGVGNTQITITKHHLMPLPSLAAIAIREGTFQQGGWKTPPSPAMLDQKSPVGVGLKSKKETNKQVSFQ